MGIASTFALLALLIVVVSITQLIAFQLLLNRLHWHWLHNGLLLHYEWLLHGLPNSFLLTGWHIKINTLDGCPPCCLEISVGDVIVPLLMPRVTCTTSNNGQWMCLEQANLGGWPVASIPWLSFANRLICFITQKANHRKQKKYVLPTDTMKQLHNVL